jgi:exodeoxyribonuclease VII small subunit
MEMNLTYDQAYAELKQITAEIESDKVSVDELTTKVKRASQLITLCQQKLQSTQAEVTNIIKQLDTAPQN